MGKIKFIPVHYWDKITMKWSDKPSETDVKFLEKIANDLNSKYALHNVCPNHPEKDQLIEIDFFDGYLDFQISKLNECNCEQIRNELIAICNNEMKAANT